jgi:hypothetical protein
MTRQDGRHVTNHSASDTVSTQACSTVGRQCGVLLCESDCKCQQITDIKILDSSHQNNVPEKELRC